MGSKHIFELASKILKPLLKDQEEYFISLIENWALIVPQNWQSGVYPIKFKWITDTKAILVVKCNCNAQAINLSFECLTIIAKINAFFGHNIITKIIFCTK